MKFYGVSVGPGDYELMTLKAVKVLEKCRAIAVPKTHRGGTMALDIIENVIDTKGKNIIYLDFIMSRDLDKNRLQHIKNAEIIIRELENNDVAMISIGDISVFSSFNYILDIVQKRGYECEIVAGVPSFCAAAAALRESLTVMKKPLHIIPGAYEDTKKALRYDGTKVIMKSGKKIDDVLDSLKDRDYFVVQNCGMDNEIIYKNGEDRKKLSSSYFTTILIKED